MGTVTDIQPASGTDPYSVVLGLFNTRDPAGADQLLSIAAGWMPTLGSGVGFEQEMADRVSYLENSMQGDMDAVLRARFSQTYQYIKDQQMNLGLYARIIRSLSRVFYGQGHRFYLLDEDGTELPADDENQLRFAEMLKAGKWMTACKTADRYTQALRRCLVKPWWDARAGCVQFSVWPQQMVYWVPNPAAYWSADDCYAVLLRMPGESSLSQSNARYELWAKIRVASKDGNQEAGEEQAEETGGTWRSLMCVVGSTLAADPDGKQRRVWNKRSVNDDDANPFVDEDTGEPIFPFVWWQADGLMQLYCVGPEDALTMPRQLNVGTTALNYSMHYENDPVGYWEPTVDQPGSRPPSVATLGPGVLVDGGEYRPAFAHPDFDGKSTLEVWKTLVDLAVQMDVGTSTGVIQESATGESGLSIQIKQAPLAEHRQDTIEIYRPFVVETLRRAIVVHNYYCGEGDEIVGTPSWEPGDIVEVQDKEAEGRQWATKIERGAATVVDWVMAETGMDEKQALERVVKNLQMTASLQKLGAGEAALPDLTIPGLDLESLPDEMLERPAAEEPEEKSKADETTGAKSDEQAVPEQPQAGSAGLLEKININQLAKAIELGAATNVDLRMAITGEDRATAERRVAEAMAHNKEIASELGETEAAKKAPQVMVEADVKVAADTTGEPPPE